MIDDTWLTAMSDPEEGASLTTQLVAHKSYPGEEGPVQRRVAAWLEANGLPAELQATEGDRPNVIARVENGEGPTLLLSDLRLIDGRAHPTRGEAKKLNPPAPR